MLKYQLFPRNISIPDGLTSIIKSFKLVELKISSESNSLKSNQVLSTIQPSLERDGYKVEKGKSDKEKIPVPVLFGMNNSIDKSFYADAISDDGKIVLEVEAGRATENNQFLKDIFEASMMHDVDYLAVAVRNNYRGHDDFEIIYMFLDTLYVSNRITLPLKGILLIGY